MVNPKCLYFRKCGGCSSQHIDYEKQLKNKKQVLADSIKFEEIKIFFDKPYNYRNRMDFIFHPKGLGLREKGKWYSIINIEKCEIAENKINNLMKEVKSFFKGVDCFDIKKQVGTFKYAVIRTPNDDSSISFVLNEDSNKLGSAVEKIKEFAKQTTANNIIISYVSHKSDVSISNEYFIVKGKDRLKEKYLGKEFLFSVQGFFQNNHKMAEMMQKYCQEILEKYNTKNSELLDLYGGVGTFGIINSKFFKMTTIIESVKSCIDAAEENIRINNAKNTRAKVLDAKYLKRLEFSKELFVITDPPRSGMHPKTIQRLKELKPKVIVYVSCNVNQLAKDILKFNEYEIKSAALFDMFPQTPHSEAVVELVLKKTD